MLIQQITVSLTSSVKSNTASSTVTKSISDRYYRALYASLHDNRLPSSSKQAMYLNLFFKSVKADAASSAGNGKNDRIKALIRRFTQVLVSGGGGATEFVAGGLYLLGEVCVFFFVDFSQLIDAGTQVVQQYPGVKDDGQPSTGQCVV
jgi:ribosome biogenesis protein MAK21